MNLDFTLFEEAKKIISEYLTPTPLVKNEWLSKKYGANIYLKLENLQPVGSFKLRGALNKIYHLTDEEKKQGVVAVSAGNHAQGVAWAASKFGVKASIIMPKPSPLIKIANTEALGAEVILAGENVDESFEYVKKYQEEHKRIYVHPFHDPLVVAGQGTIAFELLEQIDKIDFVFGSIGGGGLMTGVGQVLKTLHPECKLIAAQASGASSMVKSLQQGKIVIDEKVATFADGIKVRVPNPEMYEHLDKLIDEAVQVPDSLTAAAMLRLMEWARIIAEGAGAINLAAFHELWEANPRRFKNKNVVLIICGGNIDINLVDRIIDKGLIETKRRINLSILLDDSPGTLKTLTELLSTLGANILDVMHDRNAPFLELQQSIVKTTLETKGPEHTDKIIHEVKKRYKVIEQTDHVQDLL
jgi:threonine dehydratase